MNVMIKVLLAAVLTVMGSLQAFAQETWQGEWDTSWTHGTARLILQQQGSRVTGTYPLYRGTIAGEVRGGVLSGTWEEDGRKGSFEIRLAADSKNFLGRRGDNDWWSGTRSTPPPIVLDNSLQSPRLALRRFLNAGNVARDYDADSWSIAADTLVFPQSAENLPRIEQLDRAKSFFELLDLFTIRFDIIDAEFRSEQQEFSISLPHANERGEFRLRFKRNEVDEWRIILPSQAEITTERGRALAALRRNLSTTPTFTKLLSPRDTLRAFLFGFSQWNKGGEILAFQTMDLSIFEEVTRQSHGEMAAHYLRRVLDKIGIEALQAIPNAGQDDEPFVLFSHPVGKIVIAPQKIENETKWLFQADTIQSIIRLYRLTENMPQPTTRLPGNIPPALHFTLRQFVADNAPVLLTTIRNTELWGMISAISLLITGVILGRIISKFLSRMIFYPIADEVTPAPWFHRCCTLCIAFLLTSPFPLILGIQPESRHVTIPLFGTVLVLCITSILWFILSAYGRHYQILVSKTIGSGDDIAVSLVFAALRATTLAGCGLGIAHFLSISTVNVLAGLGIGGLAVAFAARETIANIFGAAVLVTDRPFRRGDIISIGDIEGAVEHVGIRSTRLKTIKGSVVIVPNAKLADTSINNFGEGTKTKASLLFNLSQGTTESIVKEMIQSARDILAVYTDAADEFKGVSLTSGSLAAIEMSVVMPPIADGKTPYSKIKEELVFGLMAKASALGVSLSWTDKESG